jgi:hypothetical protein
LERSLLSPNEDWSDVFDRIVADAAELSFEARLPRAESSQQ